MSSRWKLLLILLVLVLVYWWHRSTHHAQPDGKLVKHLDNLCEIAGDHVEKPDKGVQKWFGYLGNNTPDMMKQLGATLVTIERVKDDDAHDARARKAADLIHTSLLRCRRTYERFVDAIESDPAALQRFQVSAERFGRTLEILLGADQAARLVPLEMRMRFLRLQRKSR